MTRSGRWLLGQRLGFSEQPIQVVATEVVSPQEDTFDLLCVPDIRQWINPNEHHKNHLPLADAAEAAEQIHPVAVPSR